MTKKEVKDLFIEFMDRYMNEDEEIIDVKYLLEVHPELSVNEAMDLCQFAFEKTFNYKSCYMNSEIYAKWKDAQTQQPKKYLSKWEDLSSVKGFYIGEDSHILENLTGSMLSVNINIFKTELQARSHGIIAAQLTQLMAHEDYNGENQCDWCDWSDIDQAKWVIQLSGVDGKLMVDLNWTYHKFIAFKREEIAQRFLENFKDLINEYYNGF